MKIEFDLLKQHKENEKNRPEGCPEDEFDTVKFNKTKDNYHFYRSLMYRVLEELSQPKIEQLTRALEAEYSHNLTKEYRIGFDQHPFLFCFDNCVYDFEKCSFVEPRPEYFLTQSCGWSYDENRVTDDSEFLNILSNIIPDPIEREYYLLFMASGFIGKSPELLGFGFGKGGNGKSLIEDFIYKTLGNYHLAIKCSYFMTQDLDSKNANCTEKDLHNIRMASFSETPHNCLS